VLADIPITDPIFIFSHEFDKIVISNTPLKFWSTFYEKISSGKYFSYQLMISASL